MRRVLACGIAAWIGGVTCGGQRWHPAASTEGTFAAPESQGARGAHQDAGTAEAPKTGALGDERFAAIDQAVLGAIAELKLPGAVVVVGTHDQVAFRKAFGHRALEPMVEPMTLDTVFDLASLTKPLGAAATVMALVDRGTLSVDDKLSAYVPECATFGKEAITLRHLLTHTAGLPPVTSLRDVASGRDEAIRRICALTPRSAPGTTFVYSDMGFILLEEVVRRVSGRDLAALSREVVFEPLGLRETTFIPPEPMRVRAATTELVDGVWLRGVVHDPRARALGGVAGHAGLFSTATDLTRYAQMFLGGGALGEMRVFRESTVRAFLAPHDVPGGVRSLGWDVQSVYSTHRGQGLSSRAVGHGGYTGTALWLDPERDVFVLFLSNRVHPNGQGQVNPLVSSVVTTALRAMGRAEGESCDGEVKPGIDVLREEHFQRLQGARIGLVTNSAALGRDGVRSVDVLRAAPGVELVALFAPEHGLGADREGTIADGRDVSTGLPVYGLFGNTFSPSSEALTGIDTIVFDMPDAGARFYTYASTMWKVMLAAAERGLRFMVLDRPNPIGGARVAGPLSPRDSTSFFHHHALPVRHGMTLGELALLFAAEDHLPLRLDVVRVSGWSRDRLYDETGLPFSRPSPNLRSMDEMLLYPGVALLEATNLSVGRGTENPFEHIGAPWIDGGKLARVLARQPVPGVHFYATTFTPTDPPYRGETCGGVSIRIADRALFEPVRTGLALASALNGLYPGRFELEKTNRLLSNRVAFEALRAGKTLSAIESSWTTDLDQFLAKREKYLL